ncbi:MAG: menaquinone biosynthesis protein [Verrucomicrobiae bacterium]|nr:menaquinone biosynthesis protein [Verrucomicrobiae bacterium]
MLPSTLFPTPPDSGTLPALAPDPGTLLRAGSVPYLNAAPLVRGIEHRLRLAPPSDLAVSLRLGELDAALLSVTEALLHPGYDILDGPCVASDGEVHSVFLAHRQPLDCIQTVFCHTASLTSVNLLRVLLAERGLRPALRPLPEPDRAPDHDAALLIGDPAIAFRHLHPDLPVWDLGLAWQQLTGLPFVYAVWVLRRDADTTSLRAELQSAALRGQRELDLIIESAPERDAAFRRRYLTRHTRHHLGAREKAGLARFADYLRRHQPHPVFPPHYVP